MTYLTGLRGITASLVVTPSEVHMFVDYTHYSGAIRLRSFRIHCTGGIPWAAAMEYMQAEGVRFIGHDPMNIPAALCLCEGFHFEWVDLGRELARIRVQKERKEIAYLQQAADATLESIREVVGHLRDGVSERECAAIAASAMVARTGEIPGFSPMIAFGANTAHPHWLSGTRRLSPGDTIVIDCGASIEGYCADITRTFFWKRASARQRRRYRIVWTALDRAISDIAPGIPCSSIDDVVRSELSRYQLDTCFPHPLGHGVGLSVHEAPYFSVDSEDELMVDMTFALEPGIFIPGWGGIRIEEMVRLSSAGPEIMCERAPVDGLLS
ncbi:MAG TPA: M24 family metallopeptidase [bacterium]|nr:M24 family metallopeptidase [bacterium]